MPITLGDLKLYAVEELAEMLHISERTVRKILREGALPGRKLARKWYVSEESLKTYFSQAQPAGQIRVDWQDPETTEEQR